MIRGLERAKCKFPQSGLCAPYGLQLTGPDREEKNNCGKGDVATSLSFSSLFLWISLAFPFAVPAPLCSATGVVKIGHFGTVQPTDCLALAAGFSLALAVGNAKNTMIPLLPHLPPPFGIHYNRV